MARKNKQFELQMSREQTKQVKAYEELRTAYLQYGYNSNTGEVYEKATNFVVTDVSTILFAKTCYASIAEYWGENYNKFTNKETFIEQMLENEFESGNAYQTSMIKGELAYILHQNTGVYLNQGDIHTHLRVQGLNDTRNSQKYLYSNTAMVDLQIAVARQWLREQGKDIDTVTDTKYNRGSFYNYFTTKNRLNNDYSHQFILVEQSAKQLSKDPVGINVKKFDKTTDDLSKENIVDEKRQLFQQLYKENILQMDLFQGLDLSSKDKMALKAKVYEKFCQNNAFHSGKFDDTYLR